MPKKFLLLPFLLALSCSAFAQGLAGERNLDRVVSLQFAYGPVASAGDLADRFGNGFSLGGALVFMPGKSPWEFGFRAEFGFGNDVKEDILAGLRTDEGFVIGNQREPADVQLRQRQLFLGPSIGYTLAIGKNKRAGLQFKTSPGYFYHRIKIQRDPVQGVSQLNEEYLAGYDRLAGGFAIHQFVGYQQLALNGALNFYVGGEIMAGFTKQLRAFDIPDNAVPSAEGRTDITLGLKAGIIIPFYFGDGEEIFYR